MREYRLDSAQQTICFGETLASALFPGDCVALVGALGAGKTHLAQGILRGLGYQAEGSPTFSLVHQYEGEDLHAAHFDLYRLQKREELLDLGWDDYLESGAVVLVEWANRFPELLPTQCIWIKLEPAGNGRRLLMEAPAGRLETIEFT